ncbi:MAG: hypothetical protein Q8J96_13265 [Rhodocyclaceae bacterium]|nr:hypothetical protein [Rhodocyclaceae bacterium]
MNSLLWLGRIAGAGGALLCFVSIAFRLLGEYWISGFQIGTLLQAGIAAMVFGCFCLLAMLTYRDRSAS